MRKRLLASMIAMVLLLSLFPVSALAAERDKGSETPVACAVTEGCTLQAGHKCECVLPDEPETTEDDPAPADNVIEGILRFCASFIKVLLISSMIRFATW